jgi:hypothetical protein
MSALTGTYINQTYSGVVHLSTNAAIAPGVSTALEDGAGNNLGISVSTTGIVTATTFVGNLTGSVAGNVTGNLTGTASFATSASYSRTATSSSYAIQATSSSYALTSSYSRTLGASLTSSANNQVRLLSSGGDTLTTITVNNVTSASFADNANSAITASYANNANLLDGINSTQLATTASNTFVGNQIITGSLTITGSVTVTGSISQNVITMTYPVDIFGIPTTYTSSMDFNSGSFFLLTLPNGFSQPMHIVPANIKAGSSAALQVTQGLSGSCQVTFTSAYKFPSGSAYQAFNSASAIDVVTFISFDGTTLKSAGANNFI